MNWSPFLDRTSAYEMGQKDKDAFLLPRLVEQVAWHKEHCREYGRWIDALHPNFSSCSTVDAVPYLPVEIFKRLRLVSSADEHLKSVESSSTSGSLPSKIFVDEATGNFQRQSLDLIFENFIGTHKRVYIIFDAMATAKGKSRLSARGAALMSLIPYASRFFFVMDQVEDKVELNLDKLQAAVEIVLREGGELIAYGFTYMLYFAHEELLKKGIRFQGIANSSYLLHSGGWKKLQELAVDKNKLAETISSVWGVPPDHVIDFYGMVESLGIIYPECSEGRRHVPYYCEVIIRDPHTLRPLSSGELGMIQLLSLLPRSSPTHSVLTDDLGRLVLGDECACGRKGKSFVFEGRAPKTGMRGCGNIYTDVR